MTDLAPVKKTMSRRGKAERALYSVLFAVIFCAGSFIGWDFFYDFCNIAGAFVSGSPMQGVVQLVRILPRALTAGTFVFMGVGIAVIYMADSLKTRANGWKKYGIVLISTGFVISAYVVAGVISGLYNSFCEGYVTLLYPLDNLILGLMIAVYGAFSVFYSRRLKSVGTELPFEPKKPSAFGVCLRLAVYIAAMSGFAAVSYGVFIMDWSHGGLFFNIMLLMNYFVSVVMVAIYRFVYIEADFARRKRIAKYYGLIFLVLNIILMILYFISFRTNLESQNINAYSIMPIEFTACVNVFMIIYGAVNIISPAVAFIKGIKK